MVLEIKIGVYPGEKRRKSNCESTREEFMEFSNIPVPDLDGVYLRVIIKVLITEINTYD